MSVSNMQADRPGGLFGFRDSLTERLRWAVIASILVNLLIWRAASRIAKRAVFHDTRRAESRGRDGTYAGSHARAAPTAQAEGAEPGRRAGERGEAGDSRRAEARQLQVVRAGEGGDRRGRQLQPDPADLLRQ